MKSLLIAICFFSLNSAMAQEALAEFSFLKRLQELPAVKAGQPLNIYYQFTNSGRVPLIITESKVECSCTVVEFPKEPIEPGGYGTVRVIFDTNGKTGWQYRKVRLMANVKKGMTELEFRVKVLE